MPHKKLGSELTLYIICKVLTKLYQIICNLQGTTFNDSLIDTLFYGTADSLLITLLSTIVNSQELSICVQSCGTHHQGSSG